MGEQYTWHREVVIHLLVTDCIEPFLRARRAENLRPVTIRNYEVTLFAFARECDAPDIDALTPAHVRQYLSDQLGRLRDTTVRQRCVVLKTWLCWLAREGYVDRTDWGEAIRPIHCDQRTPLFLGPEQVRNIIAAARHTGQKSKLVAARNPAMILVLLDTAVRRNELLNMRIGDVDLVGRSILIRRESKSRRDRTVWFGSSALRALRAYLRVREHYPGEWLWLAREGNRLSVNQVGDLVRVIGQRCGIPDLHPHALRHTAATLLIRSGMSAQAVKELLGHRTLETTYRYVHLCAEDVQEEHRRVSALDRVVAEVAG